MGNLQFRLALLATVSKNLSVCLWSTLTPIISGLAEQNGLKKLGHLWQKRMSLIVIIG